MQEEKYKKCMEILKKIDLYYSDLWSYQKITDKNFEKNEICCESCKGKGYFINNGVIDSCRIIESENDSYCVKEEKVFDNDGFAEIFIDIIPEIMDILYNTEDTED